MNDPGGTFDFGVLPLAGADRLEFVRGAQSTLYGSDAMTSVVQVFTRTGSTRVPELRFGADGGNLGTANGYASLAGANGRFDYNLFADQFNTMRPGPERRLLKLPAGRKCRREADRLGVTARASPPFQQRHRSSRRLEFQRRPYTPSGLRPARPAEQPAGQRGSHDCRAFALATSFHRLRIQTETYQHSARQSAGPGGSFGFPIDTPFHAIANINRAGFDYQGDYTERSWAHTTVGYEFEDENGTTGSLPDSLSHGFA